MRTSAVCIRDKTGKRYWNTTCSTAYIDPEIRNMQRRLDAAARNPERYGFLDLATAVILVNDMPYQVTSETDAMSDNELLKALGL